MTSLYVAPCESSPPVFLITLVNTDNTVTAQFSERFFVSWECLSFYNRKVHKSALSTEIITLDHNYVLVQEAGPDVEKRKTTYSLPSKTYCSVFDCNNLLVIIFFRMEVVFDHFFLSKTMFFCRVTQHGCHKISLYRFPNQFIGLNVRSFVICADKLENIFKFNIHNPYFHNIPNIFNT